MTDEKYTGQLNNFELISMKGDVKLLKSEAVEFKQYQDNIWYLAAYESPEEYYVIFLENDGSAIDRDKEYIGAVYHCTSAHGNRRYTGYTRIVPWEMIIDMMEQVRDH